jgi:hypothetical protein
MSLVLINHIPASIREIFSQKVKLIAERLSINPDWLMMVMYAESKLKPTAQNKQNGRLVAAGLLQFTSASGIAGMPQMALTLDYIQQLDYVEMYFKPYKGKLKSYHDVYAVTFFPALVGKADNWVLSTKNLSASLLAQQNKVVDINRDNQITVAEFKQYVRNTIPVELRNHLSFATNIISATGRLLTLPIAIIIASLIAFYKVF